MEIRRCTKCGAEIVNGDNGCMLMDECFDCHGRPKYPAPHKPNGFTFREFSFSGGSYRSYAEEMCLGDTE